MQCICRVQHRISGPIYYRNCQCCCHRHIFYHSFLIHRVVSVPYLYAIAFPRWIFSLFCFCSVHSFVSYVFFLISVRRNYHFPGKSIFMCFFFASHIIWWSQILFYFQQAHNTWMCLNNQRKIGTISSRIESQTHFNAYSINGERAGGRPIGRLKCTNAVFLL